MFHVEVRVVLKGRSVVVERRSEVYVMSERGGRGGKREKAVQ